MRDEGEAAVLRAAARALAVHGNSAEAAAVGQIILLAMDDSGGQPVRSARASLDRLEDVIANLRATLKPEPPEPVPFLPANGHSAPTGGGDDLICDGLFEVLEVRRDEAGHLVVAVGEEHRDALGRAFDEGLPVTLEQFSVARILRFLKPFPVDGRVEVVLEIRSTEASLEVPADS
jgi:hypothetical protein